ncbi:hypothetical protein ETAA1_61980 [Urbifossiella limnaea]|uniref:Uncharacterized protein n=1 Tax=Urbifossiella limnaea TaxID=2528023 RepID=A0A517Y3D6_9BACT|nr:hypothetical protein ETAA1_61980 [Urbifossiella limnaea]
MSIYPPRSALVNLGGPLDPDPFSPGQVCPGCRGVSTFYHRDPATGPELVCTDCLTGAFDTTDPSPPPPTLRVRVLGPLPNSTIVIHEYYLDPPVAPGPAILGRAVSRRAAKP